MVTCYVGSRSKKKINKKKVGISVNYFSSHNNSLSPTLLSQPAPSLAHTHTHMYSRTHVNTQHAEKLLCANYLKHQSVVSGSSWVKLWKKNKKQHRAFQQIAACTTKWVRNETKRSSSAASKPAHCTQRRNWNICAVFKDDNYGFVFQSRISVGSDNIILT